MLVRVCVVVIFVFLSSLSAAATPATKVDSEVVHIQALLQQLVDVNLRYKDKFHNIISTATLEQQTPHATLLLCSDSRVDTGILSDTPAGEMFVVRNIGNQIHTAYGSVEYGVNHLHTQLLVVVGHSECGAIKAAMQDYSNESSNLKAELNSLEVNPKDSLNQNLINNVNHQIQDAAATFKDKMLSGEVVLIGMIYDMHDDFGFGHGQLILVNINTLTDVKSLADNKYVKGLKGLKIYGQ